AFAAGTGGIDQPDQVEILQGVAEGDRVATTGAAALRDGDRVLVSGEGGEDGASPRGNGQRQGGGRQRGAQIAAGAQPQANSAGARGEGRGGQFGGQGTGQQGGQRGGRRGGFRQGAAPTQ